MVYELSKKLNEQLIAYVNQNINKVEDVDPHNIVNTLDALHIYELTNFYGGVSGHIVYNEDTGLWVNIDLSNFIHEEIINPIIAMSKKYNNQSYINIRKKVKTKRFVQQLIKELTTGNKIPETRINNARRKICVKNGVVDIETLMILPFDKKYFFTKKIVTDYNPHTESVLFDHILTIFKDTDIKYVQNLAGQGLLDEKTSGTMNLFYIDQEENYNLERFISLLNTTALASVPGHEQLFTTHKQIETVKSLKQKTLTVENVNLDKLNPKLIALIRASSVQSKTKSYYIQPRATVYGTFNHLPAYTKLTPELTQQLSIIPVTNATTIINPEAYRTLGKQTFEKFLAWRIQGAHYYINNIDNTPTDNIKHITKLILTP